MTMHVVKNKEHAAQKMIRCVVRSKKKAAVPLTAIAHRVAKMDLVKKTTLVVEMIVVNVIPVRLFLLPLQVLNVNITAIRPARDVVRTVLMEIA